MPEQEPSRDRPKTSSEHLMTVTLFAPLRLAPDLNRRTERVIKAHSNDRDHFTDITISESRTPGNPNLIVQYLVKASSPRSALRVGAVYLSQLCDLLSAITQCPVKFFLQEEDAREERGRMFRQGMRVDRTLSLVEWSWVTGSLVALQQQHPRYLAAASWYRKGLIGNDCLDDFCCFWRVIERIAESYADKSDWAKGDGGVRKSVAQLTADLFAPGSAPELLSDEQRVRSVVKLRNDISHGNEPITLSMIDLASEELEALEEAAFAVLDQMRRTKLEIAI
jgi:hypothetical protein